MADRPVAAFLRGVNVGGHRPVSMSDLRDVFARLGYERVRTHLQSGNVVFSASGSPGRLRAAIEAACAAQLGLTTIVLLRTEPDLSRVVARNPFAERVDDPAKLHVVFLAERPAAKAVAVLDPASGAPDEWVLDGRHVYVWYPNGAGRSQLRLDFGIPATARNWNTVTKVLGLLQV